MKNLICNGCINEDVNKNDIYCGRCYRQLQEQKEELQKKIDNLLNALRDMRCEG